MQNAQYSYRQRTDETIHVEATADGLSWRNTKRGETSVTWADVKRIRLLAPMEGVYTCEVTTRTGDKLVLANRSMVSFGEFRPQDATYRAFILKMHAHAEPHVHIERVAGNAAGYALITVLLALTALLTLVFMVVLVLAFLEGKLGLVAMPALAPLIVATPLLMRWRKKNAPGPYRAQRVPTDMLPS